MEKMLNKTIYSPIITLVLIISLFLFIGYTSIFMHIHVLQDGQITYHSHFTKKQNTSDQSKASNHSHTKQEFLYYYITTVIINYLISIVFIVFCVYLLLFLSETLNQIIHLQAVNSFFSRRAPPALAPHTIY